MGLIVDIIYRIFLESNFTVSNFNGNDFNGNLEAYKFFNDGMIRFYITYNCNILNIERYSGCNPRVDIGSILIYNKLEKFSFDLNNVNDFIKFKSILII